MNYIREEGAYLFALEVVADETSTVGRLSLSRTRIALLLTLQDEGKVLDDLNPCVLASAIKAGYIEKKKGKLFLTLKWMDERKVLTSGHNYLREECIQWLINCSKWVGYLSAIKTGTDISDRENEILQDLIHSNYVEEKTGKYELTSKSKEIIEKLSKGPLALKLSRISWLNSYKEPEEEIRKIAVDVYEEYDRWLRDQSLSMFAPYIPLHASRFHDRYFNTSPFADILFLATQRRME